ncbi:MAG: transposase [Deltaproteobacteria bacterium]|nr:transposase [Deltaproteobacteria bacterium]
MQVRCRPWREQNKHGRFGKSAFKIDLRRRLVTCPSGKQAEYSANTPTAYFGAETCDRCRLRARCTDAKAGRAIRIHPHESLHRKLEARRATGARTTASSRSSRRRAQARTHRRPPERPRAIQGRPQEHARPPAPRRRRQPHRAAGRTCRVTLAVRFSRGRAGPRGASSRGAPRRARHGGRGFSPGRTRPMCPAWTSARHCWSACT